MGRCPSIKQLLTPSSIRNIELTFPNGLESQPNENSDSLNVAQGVYESRFTYSNLSPLQSLMAHVWL